MTVDLPIQRNELMGTWEIRFSLEARIVPKGKYGEEYPAMYTPDMPLTITFSDEYINKANEPEQIIAYVHRQVQNLWTQAIAGVSSKYADVLLESLMPLVEQLIRDKDWGLK